ncbi:hypothetical protein [Legionella impletisoli]|uniref:MSHA biogenesis protein MshK n=1 Tax=Legionella impletisoli TaxID=343510 RepID=A0A917NB27_9GAMM|nr:hypothetical protein [Legionella impletisoli]GGI85112.1 hypothetical protein GCM10007966_12130 [Legionella impletisoli]
MNQYALFKFCLILVFPLLSGKINAATEQLRDPTRPSLYRNLEPKGDKKNQSYNLQSVIIGKSRRMALINDKFVTVGDVVGDAKVVAIERNSVVLSESGRRLTIYLFDRSIWN